MKPAFPPDPATWARLSPLLDAALDLPPAERVAWLADLRRRSSEDAVALESLLASHESARRGDFLAKRAVATGPAGQRLGPWTIESPLGEGGMASVWLARRSDGRHEGLAAIKLMHSRLHSPQARQRFEREGHILGRIQHPHIARLLDAGVANQGDGGQPYLVLELVRGQVIDRWCDERRLDIDARLRLFVDVAQAVAAAHAQLVVHRDIKPGNVLVDEQGQVKLLDFGIARLLDDDEGVALPHSGLLTRTGQRAYTPAWAAPEQFNGQAVSVATDVWALGVLLCHLLTGRHPSGLPWTSDLTAWMQAASQPANKRPSRLAANGEHAAELADARGLQAAGLVRRLQGELDHIVQRAVAEEPERRYSSAQALADDVRRHLRHEPVSAVPDTVSYRAGKFVRRNRLAVGAASTTLLALLIGMAGTTWQALEARTQRDHAQRARAEAVVQAQRAESERLQAVKQLDRAEAMNELMAYALGPVSDKPLSVLDVLKRGETMVDKQFADAPELQIFMKNQLAVYWSHGRELDRMQTQLQEAQAIAQRIGDATEVTHLECRLAFIETEQGRFDAALARIERALAALTSMSADPQAKDAQATCLRRRAHAFQQQGKSQQALADIDAALALIPTSGRGQTARRLNMQATRAMVLSDLGQSRAAIQGFEEVLAEADRRGVLDATAQSVTYNNFQVALNRAGQIARALEAIEKSLLLGQGPGAERGATWVERTSRAQLLVHLGRTAEALPVLAEAVADARRSGEPRAIGYRAYFYAQGLCAAKRWSECAEHAEVGSRTLGSILVKTHPAMGGLALLKARVALGQGSTSEARAEWSKAAAIFGAGRPPMPGHIGLMTLQSEIERQDLRLDAALAAAKQALEMARDMFKDFPQSQRVGAAYIELGRVHKARGEMPEAREALTQALSQFEAALGPSAPATMDIRTLLATL
ncbi:MAG: Serine/threonine-protein kinase PrkC [Pseudomonadota bacterium]|jgi:serine/threonine-protein kinase